MRQFALSHSRDGWAISVTDAPWWARLIDEVGQRTIFPLMTRAPEWAWNVPVGTPDYSSGMLNDDGTPWNTNTLGSRMWDIGQWPMQFAWRHTTQIAYIHISRDDAEKLNPGWVADWEREDVDD